MAWKRTLKFHTSKVLESTRAAFLLLSKSHEIPMEYLLGFLLKKWEKHFKLHNIQ